MARSRNSLLGQGGQRKKLDRSALRGGYGPAQSDQDDAARRKEELLKKLRAKTEEQAEAGSEEEETAAKPE